MEESHRHCVVMFDEMSLNNKATDSVNSVVELLDQKFEVCNRAQVFLVRGITADWKQPVAYYFSNNAAPFMVLRDLLLSLLQHLFAVQLIPVGVMFNTSINR